MARDIIMMDAGRIARSRMQGVTANNSKVVYSSSRLRRIAPLTPNLQYVPRPKKFHPQRFPLHLLSGNETIGDLYRKVESQKRDLDVEADVEGPEPKRLCTTSVAAEPEVTPEVRPEVIPEAIQAPTNVDAEDHPTAPLEAPLPPQPETEHAILSGNNILRGATDALVPQATGIFRAAHLAMQQCVRSGVQMAATLRRHLETRGATQEVVYGLAASAQLEAELTQHVAHLSSLSAIIPSFDDLAAAQLQAEFTTHIASLPVAVFPPPMTLTNTANLVFEDQVMTNQESMTAEDAVRPAEDLSQEAAEASSDANGESDAPEIRADMSTSGGHPTISPVFDTRIINNWRPCPIITTRPSSPPRGGHPLRVVRGRSRNYYIAPDADEGEEELALRLEAEERGEAFPAVEPEGQAPGETEDVQDVEQQPAEPVAPQAPAEVAQEAVTMAEGGEVVEESDEEDDGNEDGYRRGVIPLLPWMRRRIRRIAPVAQAAAAIPVVAAAVAEPAEPAIPNVPVFPAPVVLAPMTPAARAAPTTPARTEAELETQVEEAANQLAATSVVEQPRTPLPEGSDPTGRSVSWWTRDTPLGRPYSACQIFNTNSPPARLMNRTAPIPQSEWDVIEADNRRQEEIEREEERQEVIREKKRSLGRVRIPSGQDVVTPLSQDWEDKLDAVMSGPAPRIVGSTLDGTELTSQKLQTCYTPMAWLTDEVVNGHLALTVEYLRRKADNLGRYTQPKYHAFSSFFYKKLSEAGFEGVARWTRRAKIHGKALLDVDTVFIPICENFHWTLLVVRPKTRTIEYFDSLYSNRGPYIDNAKEYLKGELGELYNEDEWFVLNSASPRQNNGSDCGVFLLTTAKAIALGLEPTVYGPPDIELLRLKIVAELLNRGLEGDFEPVDVDGRKRL
jgi:Ulp1 protease family, C-terminal catalytic domain